MRSKSDVENRYLLKYPSYPGVHENSLCMTDSFASRREYAIPYTGYKFGRVIVLATNHALTCAGYGYQYAYRPDALILVKGACSRC
jgi:hypothetical protein